MSRLNIVIVLFSLYLHFNAYGQDINAGRFAYYSFTGNADDDTGNYSAVVYGAILVSDRFENSAGAYYFDGIDDYITIPHKPAFNFGADDDFSISLWTKISEQVDLNGNNDLIGKWNTYTSSGYPYAIRYYSETAGQAELKNKILAIRYDTETCNHIPYVKTNCFNYEHFPAILI